MNDISISEDRIQWIKMNNKKQITYYLQRAEQNEPKTKIIATHLHI